MIKDMRSEPMVHHHKNETGNSCDLYCDENILIFSSRIFIDLAAEIDPTIRILVDVSKLVCLSGLEIEVLAERDLPKDLELMLDIASEEMLLKTNILLTE